MDVRGKTALVTGASSGIGEHFARQLAAAGANVIISARRGDRLKSLAEELTKKHGVEVTTVVVDLSTTEGPTRLFEETEGKGTRVDILINNAGFGTQDDFLEIPWEKVGEQLQLNVVSLTELTHRFGRVMRERKSGHILNVASIGAYMPVPNYATYSAGKAYVRNFTEALAWELAPSGVRVCCLNPGGTKTEFMEVAGHSLSPSLEGTLMSAERCARIGLDALFGWRRNVVAGFLNKLMTFSLRFVPRRWIVSIAALVMARPRKPQLLAAPGS